MRNAQIQVNFCGREESNYFQPHNLHLLRTGKSVKFRSNFCLQ